MTKLFSIFRNTMYILNDCHYLAVNNIFHPKRYIVNFTLFRAQNLMNLRMQLHILGVFMFQLSFLNIKSDRKFSKVIHFLFCHLVSSRIEKHLNKNAYYLYTVLFKMMGPVPESCMYIFKYFCCILIQTYNIFYSVLCISNLDLQNFCINVIFHPRFDICALNKCILHSSRCNSYLSADALVKEV